MKLNYQKLMIFDSINRKFAMEQEQKLFVILSFFQKCELVDNIVIFNNSWQVTNGYTSDKMNTLVVVVEPIKHLSDEKKKELLLFSYGKVKYSDVVDESTRQIILDSLDNMITKLINNQMIENMRYHY